MPTCTPTLGMKRKTGASTSRIVSSVDVGTPAATDAIALVGVISSLTSRSTRSTSTGFTHSTTTSASEATSALCSRCRTPWCSASAAARPEPRSVTRIRPAMSGSARTQPRTMADAMLPAPSRPRVNEEEATRPKSVPEHRPVQSGHGDHPAAAGREHPQLARAGGIGLAGGAARGGGRARGPLGADGRGAVRRRRRRFVGGAGHHGRRLGGGAEAVPARPREPA